MTLKLSDLNEGLQKTGALLSAEQLQCFESFVVELEKWNRKINLTSIREDSDVCAKHIFDSIMLALKVGCHDSVLDIGSGAGFPAIPIKVMKPLASVMSIDAVGKKIQFQRHVARLLKLSGFSAVHGRVEHMGEELRSRFDVITSRAFSDISKFVACAVPMLKPDGRILAMKGTRVDAEIDEAREAIEAYGLRIGEIDRFELPQHKGERAIVTISFKIK